jgi:N utilization substance protein A
MINKDFFKQAEELAIAKGITIEEFYDLFSKGLVNSFKKMNGNTSCKVVINPAKSEILLYSVHKVVEEYTQLEEGEEKPEIEEMLLADAKKIKSSYKVGDIVEQQINIKNFGRTAIAAVKNVFTQGIKTLEREKAYDYFKELEEEMVTATVTNIGEKFIVLNLGHNVTTTLPKSELLANDSFNIDDNIRVYIKKVEKTNKDPKVIVSRNEKHLVIRLMETYTPEIKSGIIEIKGIARDAGDRSKIALHSNDPKVDAIGSCVGEGGSRIREIVNALGGEKVDLYKWSEDPVELISNSLQPSSVTKVLNVDLKTKTSQVVVPDEHLSLAIGKSGQNVRLAVQSCGWKIDIMPTSEAYAKGHLEGHFFNETV